MPAQARDVKGLDTFRFIAAVCVALSHGAAFPLGEYVKHSSGVAHVLIGIYHSAFDGPAAVMMFFVISGFCIHYSFACGTPFQSVPFLTRRFLRIIPPLVGALLLARVLGKSGALYIILWSVYCELIYYVIYPGLRILFRRYDLRLLIGISLTAAILLILSHWDVMFQWEFAVYLAWILGLPAWLLGCLLAEDVANGMKPTPTPVAIWMMRLGVWAYMAISTVIAFHAPIKIGYPVVLLPFYLLCYVWLGWELRYWQQREPSRFLEWGGKWSYSLYLIHKLPLAMIPAMIAAPSLSWVLRIAAITAASLLFYIAIERPSHRLARSASRWAASKTASAAGVTF